MNLSKNALVTRVSNAVAAGTTDVNCTAVDMSGYDSVTFIAAFGALTATQVTNCFVQGSDDNSSFSDLAGTRTTSMADGDGNKLVVVEVQKPNPSYRYIRLVIDRGTANAVIDGVVAVQTHARKAPVTNGSTVQATKLVVSPAAGTP